MGEWASRKNGNGSALLPLSRAPRVDRPIPTALGSPPLLLLLLLLLLPVVAVLLRLLMQLHRSRCMQPYICSLRDSVTFTDLVLPICILCVQLYIGG